MVVQHNLTAMNSNRMLGVTTSQQAKTTEKLSSGYKINRAADDAAGLAISEKMRKQIRGLTQATANAQDGISAVQTAEGALTEVHDMLQRMNELAVKAANGTQSESDRKAVQAELDQLTTEIDRVAETTKFNETYLLKGDTSATAVKGYNFSYKPVGAANVISQIAMAGATPGKHEGTGITITPTAMKEGDTVNASAEDMNFLLKSIRDQGLSVTALSEYDVNKKDTNGNAAAGPKDTAYTLVLNGDAAKKFSVVTKKEAGVVNDSAVKQDMLDALKAAYDKDVEAEGEGAVANYTNVIAELKKKGVENADATAAAAVVTAMEGIATAKETYDQAVAEDEANGTTNADRAALTAAEEALFVTDTSGAAVLGKMTAEAKDTAVFEIRDASANKLMEVKVNGYTRTAKGPGDVFTDTITMTAKSTIAFEKGTDRAQYYDKDGNKISENALDNYVAFDGTNVVQKAGTKLYDALGNETAFKTAYINAIQDKTATLRFGLHVGSDATRNNQITLNIDSMSAKGLGLVGLRVDGTNDANALSAVATIKAALDKVSAQRSDLGAVQNRLEHTINNLGNVVENTTSAESAIRDTDMATTMVQYSKNNILAQAGTSMLAQANQSNQSVLSLLQ